MMRQERGRIPARQAGRGFSMVELLVVIGVVMMLLTLLMPALKKAKDKAQQIVCANNLKQIHLAWTWYYNDYNGWLIPSCFANGVYWIHNLPPCVTIYSYMPRREMYSCPSSPLPVYGATMPTKYGLNANTKVSPSFACGATPTPVNIGNLTQPSRTVIFSDSGLDSTGNSRYTAMNRDQIGYWHNKRAGIVFVDGHTGAVGSSEFTADIAVFNEGSYKP